MEVINFAQAKRRIQNRHQEEAELKTAFKLRYLSNAELFREYRTYRNTLEDTNLDASEEKLDTNSLIYLCEVALEVAARGLLEDFDKRYNFVLNVVE